MQQNISIGPSCKEQFNDAVMAFSCRIVQCRTPFWSDGIFVGTSLQENRYDLLATRYRSEMDRSHSLLILRGLLIGTPCN